MTILYKKLQFNLNNDESFIVIYQLYFIIYTDIKIFICKNNNTIVKDFIITNNIKESCVFEYDNTEIKCIKSVSLFGQ